MHRIGPWAFKIRKSFQRSVRLKFMVSLIISCPHCLEQERVRRCVCRCVRRYGGTRRGSERCCCNVCRRAFTPSPQSRSLSLEKPEQILRALQEKTPLTALARTLHVSPNTIYALLEKTWRRFLLWKKHWWI